MAEICCGVVSESEASPTSSRAARKRRMELRRVKLVTGVAQHPDTEDVTKKSRLEIYPANALECWDEGLRVSEMKNGITKNIIKEDSPSSILSPLAAASTVVVGDSKTTLPKFGMASVCGRRRDMEDAVAIHPSFCGEEYENADKLHYFGVYDGHGCSHVAAKCRDRLHELVKEELQKKNKVAEDNRTAEEWKNAMERSFMRMDKEASITFNENFVTAANCRCDRQTHECDAVGSAAVVAIVTSNKIIVANCGDSRAVLCRKGEAVPLSNDHKPDRPDELNRIQAAGGRVIYWDCPRVQGVLAMSRAIGDNYLKPYVSCEPEVTITERKAEDECLILASDGLWDVVSNDTACGVARMCLKGKGPAGCLLPGDENSDKACSDASMLLTKLALARRSADNVSVVVIDLRRDIM